MTTNIEVRAYTSPATRTIDLWLWCSIDGVRFVGDEVTDSRFNFLGVELEECDGIANPPGPAVRLTEEAAQVLMNSLWECGLRPAGAAGSAGQLAATQAHLEDFRRIAFKQLGIEQ